MARAGAIDVTAILTVGAVITATLSTVVKGATVSNSGLAGLTLITAGAALVAALAAIRHPVRPVVP